jgi:prevent-host-death family protein
VKTVGVRELKNRLSAYLRDVRGGEVVRVTDRGEVVAELVSPGDRTSNAGVPAGLAALARQGLATIGPPGDASVYPALPREGRRRRTAAELLEQERGAR